MKLLGVLLIIFGTILALWLGLYVLFVGGIVQIVNAIKATPVNALGVAWGIVRMLCSGFVGWITFIVSCALGQVLIES